MKTAGIMIFALLMCVAPARGQNADSSQKKDQESVSEKQPGTPLKLLVVISEFEGEKKIASLPYTLYTLTAGPAGPFHPVGGPRESMRYQLRVPIVTGTFSGASDKANSMVNTQWTYQDVGTDIDYAAFTVGADSYELAFTVDRSWASVPSSSGQETPSGQVSLSMGHPMLPHFRNSFVVILRNGQTAEGASATDPVTGHVLKVDVTLTVLK